ncbi:MotA/TolQ/ExbB proton channel family protein [hydrothermal vent metagenome]|uniref:MotA/TolQ/ExbB proton channel family protein n=1 Tax=hydrothermal vent metagenome TaxID=652676 RepID=A0A3B0X7M4_9ZZZZ
MFDEIVTFFKLGGIFMAPIVIVLAFGVAVAIERYMYLTAVKVKNRKLLAQLMPLLKSGDLNQVYKITSQSKVAMAQMLNLGLTRLKVKPERDQIEMAMEESLMEIIPRLEKRTHYLAMFANIATLLGLLGTISGLIKAFTAVANVDPSLKAEILSGSISVAMNTTAMGLGVAIPLIIVFSLLQTKTTEIVDSLEIATIKFVNLIMLKQ